MKTRTQQPAGTIVNTVVKLTDHTNIQALEAWGTGSRISIRQNGWVKVVSEDKTCVDYYPPHRVHSMFRELRVPLPRRAPAIVLPPPPKSKVAKKRKSR